MKSLRKVYPFLLLISSVLVNAASPNIVIILADDFGVGDIQAHYPDNKIATPYLDKLSAESKRFTNAHSNTAHTGTTAANVATDVSQVDAAA